jgi:tetrahydromethanopterin S-methyltransferase subunit E
MFGALKGYKTYIVAILAIGGAVAAVLTGDMMLPDAAKIIVDAIIGATIRSAIANK